MDYKFSLTARLVALGSFGLVALMVLLFALGVVVGQRMATPSAAGGDTPVHAAKAQAEEPEAAPAPTPETPVEAKP